MSAIKIHTCINSLRSIILSGIVLLCALNTQAQKPLLNSYPQAKATIFIDFDGHTVTGSVWNWSGPIYALPAELSNDAISEIFNRVSEDFRPFNLNITTDSTVYLAAPYNRRVRVIVTPTSKWYGSAGGVSMVGSFTYGDETPAWVFSTLLGNDAKVVAEAISHEAGHTLGLQHQSDYDAQCKRIAEYGVGAGSGQIGWAPIMGVGYYKNLTTWHNGKSVIGCNYIQNDLEVIASASNGFGYRDDDHGNEPAEATKIKMDGVGFLVDGIINQTGDVDAFKFDLSSPANFQLNAIPENVGTGNSGANVDIRIHILNSSKDTIGIYNPSTLLDAGIDTALNSGTYYVLIDGVGNVNKSAYGSLGYYSMTGMVNAVLPLRQFKLRGSSAGGRHLLEWSVQSDEAIRNIIVESSTDGNDFQPLVTLKDDARQFSYQTISGTLYYRLRATVVATGKAYYSNTIRLQETESNASIKLLSNIISQTIEISSSGNYSYQLADAAGKVLMSGKLQSGINRLPVPSGAQGMLFLRLNDNRTTRTERFFRQ